MKVTFAYAQWTGDTFRLWGYFARSASTWTPLAQSLLAAVCERAGHDVTIIDGEALRLNKETLARRVVETNPDVVCITCYSPFFHLSADLAAEIKKLNPKQIILAGGPHVTIVKQDALLPQFDYLFKGEAERALPLFLETLSAGGDVSRVPGLIFKRDNEVIDTGEPLWVTTTKTTGKNIDDHRPLDALPFPARHLLPMDRYFLGTRDGKMPMTSIMSSRGCPWECVFCASEVLKTTRYILRSPGSVVEEMEKVKTDFPFIKHFFFGDDVLTLYAEKHIIKICDGINASKILRGKITFEGSTRANLVDDAMMKYLAETGLVRISFGLESVDPEVRVVINKRCPIDAYWEANRLCNKYGVEALNSMMIGLPGDTKEKVKFTIRTIAAQRDVKQANLAIAIPYPGTKFSEMATMGEQGITLLDTSGKSLQRYDNAITQVNDMSPETLVKLQNWGFVMIYLTAPWRWGPVVSKHGILGFLLQFVRLGRLIKDLILDRCRALPYPGTPA